MQTTKLMLSSLSAWAMAGAYDYIERATGTEFNVLLWAAVVIMIGGLYFGLYAKNKNIKEEKA